MNKHLQFTFAHYRNAIYQGMFDTKQQIKNGCGLLYLLHDHTVIGSYWYNNQASGPTFIYKKNGNYMYGYWNANNPDGFNLLKINDMLIMGFYRMGTLQGNMLVIYEKYNFAAILSASMVDNRPQFDVLTKGQIFCDQDFHKFIQESKWEYFQDNWKTLIKFLSANFAISDTNVPQLKLRLVNQIYYRFGYDDGLALVFDDSYTIISMGIHKKSKLKSLGIRKTAENFIQQGDFNSTSTIIAYNHHSQRPSSKIQTIFHKQLLSSINFVNEQKINHSQNLFDFYHKLAQCNLFKGLLSGLITNRRLDLSYDSKFNTNQEQQKMKNIKVESNKNFDTHQKLTISLNNESLINSGVNYVQTPQEERRKLEIFKKQIMNEIQKKKNKEQGLYSSNQNEAKHIINKIPVLITSKKNQNQESLRQSYMKKEKQRTRSKSKNRSPIFTPEKKQTKINLQQISRSPSPIVDKALSPFREKMRSKIFKQNNTKKAYIYQPIAHNQNQAKHIPQKDHSNHLKNFQSPYYNLQLSQTKAEEKNQSYYPVSLKKQMLEQKPLSNQAKKTVKFVGIQEDEIMKQQKNMLSKPNEKNRKNTVYLLSNDRSTSNKKKPNYNNKYERSKPKNYLDQYRQQNQGSKEKVTDSYSSRQYNQTIQTYNKKNRVHEILTSPKNVKRKQVSPPRRKYEFYFN